MTNICEICDNDFTPLNGNPKARFCSDPCRAKMYNDKVKENNLSRKLGLNTGETGSINEFTVISDLIIKGYKVFTPFDSTAKTDLLIYDGQSYKTVQVKTGAFGRTMQKLPAKLKNTDHDILAVVYNLKDIDYEPPIPSIR